MFIVTPQTTLEAGLRANCAWIAYKLPLGIEGVEFPNVWASPIPGGDVGLATAGCAVSHLQTSMPTYSVSWTSLKPNIPQILNTKQKSLR